MIDGGPFVTAARSQIGALGIMLSVGHGFTAMSRACAAGDIRAKEVEDKRTTTNRDRY